jgi:hypothetical protein
MQSLPAPRLLVCLLFALWMIPAVAVADESQDGIVLQEEQGVPYLACAAATDEIFLQSHHLLIVAAAEAAYVKRRHARTSFSYSAACAETM